MRRAKLRAALLLLPGAALIFSLAPLASAAVSKEFSFQPPADRSSWFWSRQVDEAVPPDDVTEVVCMPPVPICPQQRVRLTGPQDSDTLPIAVFNGQHDKVSAVFFDLLSRGVVVGSEITELSLTIQEGSSAPGGQRDRPDFPNVNAAGKVIQACPAEEFWPAGEAEKIETVPDYDQSGCVDGKRNTKKDPATWTFNLTEMAEPWGPDPFSNSGVVLIGKVKKGAQGAEATWQINLKSPVRDDQTTPKQDEFKETKDRIVVELAFVPGETEVLPPVEPPSTAPVFQPSTSFGTPEEPEAPAPPEEEPAQPEQEIAAPVAQTGPELPGYVWGLIPAGLLALSAVRSVVLEPTGGPRQGGVIQAIRKQNAARHGLPFEESKRGTGRLARVRAGIKRWTAKGIRTVARR